MTGEGEALNADLGESRIGTIEGYENLCFVIMPFGEKPVGEGTVNFDTIYQTLFKPAIEEAKLPEGATLKPKRTDKDAFSSSINQDMFEYITYSRLAFVDISGANPNVLYELGARHALQEAGTVIFRQKGHDIPYDIRTIKVFEYEHDTSAAAETSRAFIAQVLNNTLRQNRLDSPIRQALRAQWRQREQAREVPASAGPATAGLPKLNLEILLQDAEEALRTHDLAAARTLYRILLRLDPANIIARMKLGMVLKDEGKIFEALEEFAFLVRLRPDYSDAWREKGVAESLIYRQFPTDKKPNWAPSGSASLERATTLNPQDADAWGSWGGVLRRISDQEGALEKYEKGAEVSDGHPYPLLNALKLNAKLTGALDVKDLADRLEKAKDTRLGQAKAVPPADAPWCFFDLAEIYLYQNDRENFLTYVGAGIEHANFAWQIKTFGNGLRETLVEPGIDFPGLENGLALLDSALEEFEKKEAKGNDA